MDTTQVPVKLSQRQPKSCTECIRRKTRCNKQIPCDVCTKRGVTTLCRLESQYAIPITAPTHSPGLMIADPAASTIEIELLRRAMFQEIDTLRRRVTELERTVGHTNKGSEENTGIGAQEDEAEDAATTLEFFALGLDRRVGGETRRSDSKKALKTVTSQPKNTAQQSTISRNVLAEPGSTPPDSVTDSLLPQHIVANILAFHNDHVYWQHACVFASQFEKEVEAFYGLISRGRWDRVDSAWLALFYILQAIAVHQMNDAETVQCGLEEPADRFVVPSALISSATAALNHADYLARPSIFTCQAIAILCVCGHNVCESDLLSSLLAIGIKTAQTLNLHSLGQAKDMPAKDREVGTRVWWALTMEDWFAIPFRGVWSVHPDHFDTQLPSNCSDSDLQSGSNHHRESDVVTIGLKSRFSAQTASIIQDTFQHLRFAPPQQAWAITTKSASRIQFLIAHLPHASPSTPRWTADMHHYLYISASHKLLVIYRAFLARGGSVTERQAAETGCLKAAEAIIEEIDTRAGSQALWTIPYHTLAAGVVLAIEVISAKSKKDPSALKKRRGLVDKARHALRRLSPTSRIARRGLQVLDDLMKEADGKRKRRSDGMATVIKRIKLPEDVLLESAPQSPDRPPTEIFPPPHPAAQAVSSVEPTTSFSPIEFEWSPSDTDALLASLQATVPDVGRLFDGSIGNFGFNFSGGAS
ncbi:hypothetical protein I317_04676 [Kwoniella heveanensis CBS 569]|nr:hypothetical protein I317_04676 [Kwoniella heveanensis CBS 569]